MKRIFLIVLDSFGIGAMKDSESFGDVGVNTLASCATSPKLHIPNMIAAGLGNIDGVSCLPKADAPIGAFARLTEASYLSERLPGRSVGAFPGRNRPGRAGQRTLERHRRAG